MNDTILEAAKRLKFIFAKSMPNIPHYYTVKDNNNKKDYERLFLHILNNGYDKKFFKNTYRYCIIGDYEYWIMTDDINISKIINRRSIL